MKEAIGEATTNNGQTSADRLTVLLDECNDKMEKMIDKRLEQISVAFPVVPQNDAAGGGGSDNSNNDGYRKHHWGGKMYDAPKTFTLPRGIKLFSGWCLWVKGDTGAVSQDDTGDMTVVPIKPFRSFTSASVPKSTHDAYKSSWMPMFKLMEEGDGVDIPSDTKNLNSLELKRLYDLGMEHVKKVASYVFDKHAKNCCKWNASTWSTKV